MHEIELGITKFLFSFLIALLEAVGGQSLIDLVDARYVSYHQIVYLYHFTVCSLTRFRQVPSFGTDTIRHFRDNPSEMKKLAARNFEDILQVCEYILIHASEPGWSILPVSFIPDRYPYL